MVSEISIEQTNRIRAALGLPLIPIPTARATGIPPTPELDKRNEIIERQIAQLKARSAQETVLNTEPKETLVSEPSSTGLWLQKMKKLSGSRKSKSTSSDPFEKPEADIVEAPRVKEVTEPIPEAAEPSNAPQLPPDLQRNQVEKSATNEPPKTLTEPSTISQPSKPEAKPKIAIGFKQRRVKPTKRRRLDPGTYDLSSEPVQLVEETDIMPKAGERKEKVAEKPVTVVKGSEGLGNSMNAAPMVNAKDSIVFLEQFREKQAESARRHKEDPGNVEEEPGKEPSVHIPVPASSVPESTSNSRDQPIPSGFGALASTIDKLRSQGAVRDDFSKEISRRNNREWARKVASDRMARMAALEEQEKELHDPIEREKQKDVAIKEDSKIAEEQYKDYNPVVELVHRDAEGNILSAKSSWRELSHRFHGTSEGKRRQKRRERTG